MNHADDISDLIEQGKLKQLYKLSRKNHELKEILSTQENLFKLFNVSNLKRYYYFDDMCTFDYLYFQYSSLKDKKKVLKYIQQYFTKEDFERAKDLGSTNLIGNLATYNDFLKYQWEMILEDLDNRKRLNYVLYMVDVGGGFGLIDKEYMSALFNEGIVYDINGNLCLTAPR